MAPGIRGSWGPDHAGLAVTFDYSGLANVAESMISQFGRPVTFLKFGSVAPTSTTPWDGTATPEQSVPGHALFVEPSSATKLGMSSAAGDLEKRYSAVILAAFGAGSSVDLTGFNEVQDGEDRWGIIVVEKLRPGTASLLFFVGVEGK